MSIDMSREIISDMGILSGVSYEEYDGDSRIYRGAEIVSDKDGLFSLSTSYTVIDYIDTPVTSMQALLLQKTGSDEYVIAFRGTQETMDVVVDAIIGINNFNPQFNEAWDFVEEMRTTYNIPKDHLTLTGHSLGGILTQSVGAVLGIKGYAFNPYGVDRLLATWPQYRPSLAEALVQVGLYRTLELLGLSTSYADFAEENILNISYNDFDAINGDPLSNLATALTSEHLGGYLAIFGENVSAGDGHRMGVLNNAIEQYNAVLSHFAPETTFADLSRAYVYGGNDGYNRINEMFTDLGVMDAAEGTLRFNFLFNTDQPTLQSQSSSLAGMYALRELLPFTINGADYSHLNQNGELNQDNYSDHYLEDRAAFLYHTMHENTEAIQYDQEGSGIRVAPPSDIHVPARYWFGSEGVDNLYGHPGANKEDHLYGMDGDDTINGYGGDDIIEGGAGSDTMYGGTGNDTFYIQGTDEAFDIFKGGADTDRILGSDENDTIRVNSLSLSGNSIEIIDGGGGVNVIAGTDGDNTIDLTGINVQHIARIEGGAGQDTLVGTEQDDVIYGSVKDENSDGSYDDWAPDYLAGGAGNDTYHIGIYDTIYDSDHQGTLWYGGNQITGLTLTQLEADGTRYVNDDYAVGYDASAHTLDVFSRNGSFNFTIENYQPGDFGLNLEAYIPPETTYTFSGASASTRAGIGYDLDDSGTYWYYGFTRNFSDTTFDYEERSISYSNPPSVNVTGGSGRDFLFGMNQSDVISGGSGDDTLYGWTPAIYDDDPPPPPASPDMGGDEMHGDGGNDYMLGSMGSDTMAGGADDDVVSGMEGDDVLFGGTGHDQVLGGAGSDILYGDDGDDYLSGDTISGINLNGTYYTYAWLQPDSGWSDFSSFSFSYSDAGYPVDVVYAGAVGLFMPHPDDQGNDYLNGGAGNDYLNGMDGMDTLLGETGNDHLDGGSGDDFLSGGTGNDWLVGGDGNDHLYGDAGNDLLFDEKRDGTGSGDDYLSGGLGDDQLVASVGNDSLHGGAGADQLIGGAGDDVLYGDADNDLLWGDDGDNTGTGNDILYGGDGDDQLKGAGGDDELHGDQGEDTLYGGEGSDVLFGDMGVDRLAGENGNDILWGGDGNDFLWGDSGDNTGTGDDELHGGAGNDLIQAAGGNDVLSGDEGDDTLYGGEGDDTLYGGAGDDYLYGGAGEDSYVFYAGDGVDFVDDSEGVNTIIINSVMDINAVNVSYGSLGGYGVVEDPDGNVLWIDYSENDVVFIQNGRSNNNYTYILGDGSIYSNAQFELYTRFKGDHYSDGDDGITGTPGRDIVYAGGGNDTISSLAGNDRIYGEEGNDLIQGGDGNDLLYGGSGDDSLAGGDGNDTLTGGAGADILDGGNGSRDSADYQNSEEAVSINLATGEGSGGDAEGDTLISIENIQGSGFNDTLVGNGENNTLYGREGNDTLIGGAGEDSLLGDIGSDTLYGSAGNDTLQGGDGDDNLYGGEGNDFLYSGSYNSDDPTGNNHLYGGEGDDTLYGGGGSDTFEGGTGSDVLYGGSQNDSYIFNAGDGIDLISDSSGINTIFFNGIADIDELMVSYAVVDMQNFGRSFSAIKHAEGNDIWIGYNENDGVLIRNGRQDSPFTYDFGNGNVYNHAEILALIDIGDFYDDGDNIIDGSSGNDIIHAGGGNDTVNGLAGNDELFGGDGNDLLNGGDGNDLITGGGGINIINGGAGMDTVDYTFAQSSVTINLATGETSTEDTLDSIENVRGSRFNDTLIGNDDDNHLMGFSGNDLFFSSGGADIIDGGSGRDIADYSGSAEAVHINLETGDTDGGDAAGDTLLSIEVVKGSEFDDILTANAKDSSSFGYHLYGNGGNDILSAGENNGYGIRMNGGDGNDTLLGGNNQDFLFGGNGADILNGGDGIDTVKYSGSTTEGVTVNLLTGEGHQGEADGDTLISIENIWGTQLDDTLTGNNDENILSGGGGNDSMRGGEGNDTLSGGTGNDTLYGGSGNDRLFGKGSNANGYRDYDGSDTLYGGAGDDYLSGNNGADYLHGGAGNDRLYGNSGDDHLYGDAGNDYLSAGENNRSEAYSGGNFLYGGDGNDILEGNEGRDVLYGDAGDDHLSGGLRQDVLHGGAGNDYLSGGDDHLAYTPAVDDQLFGEEGNDQLEGGSGNDILDGGTGNDTLFGGRGDDIFTFNTGDGVDIVTDELGTHLNPDNNTIRFNGIDNIHELSVHFATIENGIAVKDPKGQDLWIDYTENDGILLTNGRINDSFNYDFGDGNIYSYVEILTLIESGDYFGNENDSISGSDENDTIHAGGGNDSIRSMDGDDIIFGEDGNDWICGGEGNDVLLGGAGNDILLGGTGADILDGGEGRDKADYRYSSEAVIVNLARGTARGGDAKGDSITSIENLAGSAFGDTLYGDDSRNSLYGNGGDDLLSGVGGNDWMRGGEGNDTMYGGAGNDILLGGTGADMLNGGEGRDKADYRYSSEAVTVSLAAGTALGGDAEGDTLSSIENLGGSEFNDTLTGNDENNSLYGNGGDDVLSGQGGNDWMRGGAGDDTLHGGDGNDTLIGGAGADLLDGGEGRDKADYRYSSEAVTVSLAAGTALGGDAEGDTFSAIENVAGSEFDDILTGDNNKNSLYGKGGDDRLFGGGGNDWMRGGAGNDTLLGGTGADMLDGGVGRDKADYRYSSEAVTVSLADGTAMGGDAEGDAFTSIENLGGSAFDDSLSGDDNNNSLYGNGGNDVLSGQGGNDWIRGGAGNDTLHGGEGDDTLLGGTGADILDGGEGLDKADYRYSAESVNVSLAAGTATGGDAEGDTFTAIENLGGSAFDDSLSGDDNNNSLYGNGGNDVLSGQGGNDWMRGGAGNDTFVFDTAPDSATNRDTIADFTAGQDRIELNNSIFTALVNEGVLAETGFHADAAGMAVDDNDYILYNTTTGVLSYDADGNGTGVAVEFGRLTSKPEISANDFVIAAG